MKVTTFNKSNLKAIRGAMKTALSEVEKEYGIEFRLNSIRYDDTSFKVTLEAEASADSEEAEERKKEKFMILAHYHGIPEDAYGKTFKGTDGKNYTVTGINPKAPKNCLLIKDEDGEEYRCPKGFLGL